MWVLEGVQELFLRIGLSASKPNNQSGAGNEDFCTRGLECGHHKAYPGFERTPLVLATNQAEQWPDLHMEKSVDSVFAGAKTYRQKEKEKLKKTNSIE